MEPICIQTGTQHGHLHQLSVTMSRVTYFILRPTQEPVLVSANTGKQKQKKSRERF